ncbi:HD domain-containing protein [Streptomyces jumonjinensis]|uniref:HD domain-containing protein n=1 Tax=Streptomyces jumonjinensis TaxID=1945 RepID=UPI0037A2804B
MNSYSAASTALGLASWPEQYRQRGKEAVALALALYASHFRDQGTPYFDHPVRVADVLRQELGVADPDILVLGLLHDALEVSPAAEHMVTVFMGEETLAQLRAMTPDHRLERRKKHAGDDGAWHEKLIRLGPETLLVRLADRVDNLRDLRHSRVADRRTRFLATLAGTYLPLAEAARSLGPHHEAAYHLLNDEYERHRRDEGEAG